MERTRIDQRTWHSAIIAERDKLRLLWDEYGDIHFNRSSHPFEYCIGVVGSRSFKDRELFDSVMARVCLQHLEQRIRIVSGGAKGADTLAREFADDNGFSYTEYPADWAKHGRQAGAIRNVEIIKNSHEVVAFWDGKSKGTAIAAYLCRLNGIPLMVIRTDT